MNKPYTSRHEYFLDLLERLDIAIGEPDTIAVFRLKDKPFEGSSSSMPEGRRLHLLYVVKPDERISSDQGVE